MRKHAAAGAIVVATCCTLMGCERAPPASALSSIESAAAISTRFDSASNPLSEGGRWIHGRDTGRDWLNVQAIPGRAFASAFVGGASDYNDCIAVLATRFGADQFAQATVARDAGYSPRTSHEVELLLRFSISAHDAHGYEVLWAHAGELNVVRWNGPLGDYTPLAGAGGIMIGPAVDGDILRAEIRGTVITVARNGAMVLAVDVTNQGGHVWTAGQPGMGFWPRAGANLAKYGWRQFEAGTL